MTDEIEIDETTQRRVAYCKSQIATPVRHIRDGKWMIEDGYIWCLTEVEDSPTSWKNEAMKGREKIAELETNIRGLKKMVDNERCYSRDLEQKYRELADGVKKLCI